MKRSKKEFTRAIAYNAYCYYINHSEANFSDTATFISKLFNVKFTKDDIGRMFRHIVIFGNVDNTARKLAHEVNKRSRYDKAQYNRFLGYRYEYPELLKELEEYEGIVYEKNQLQFLLSEYKSFASSEMEREKYLENLQKKYNDISISFNLLNFNYIFKLKERIKKIEEYRVNELL